MRLRPLDIDTTFPWAVQARYQRTTLHAEEIPSAQAVSEVGGEWPRRLPGCQPTRIAEAAVSGAIVYVLARSKNADETATGLLRRAASTVDVAVPAQTTDQCGSGLKLASDEIHTFTFTRGAACQPYLGFWRAWHDR